MAGYVLLNTIYNFGKRLDDPKPGFKNFAIITLWKIFIGNEIRFYGYIAGYISLYLTSPTKIIPLINNYIYHKFFCGIAWL